MTIIALIMVAGLRGFAGYAVGFLIGFLLVFYRYSIYRGVVYNSDAATATPFFVDHFPDE